VCVTAQKPFRADIRQWKTLAAFTGHLAAHDPRIAPWAHGLVLHHTWVPTAEQWRGRRSVNGLVRWYRDQVPWEDKQGNLRHGWEAGPHLFVVDGSLDPRWDGIWQLTPLNEPGVHAGAWNRTHWGVEVVGDYDDHPWPPKLAELVYGVCDILLRWRHIRPTLASVRGHRECGSPKSCPGWQINMDAVRAELQRRMR
jgi:hypothetical protein